MTRIAIIADIHGNLPALEAVMRDIQSAAVDLVIANGDLADGPFPAQTLDLLMALGDRCIGLRGNGDRWLVEAYDGLYRPRDKDLDAMIAWAACQLTPAHRAYLAALPMTRVMDHPRVGTIGVCHATARSDNEMFLVDSHVDQARDAFDGLSTPLVCLGHTHMPFDRLFDRRRFVNTGSVGMPYGHSGAAWAMIDHDVVLRRTTYTIDEVASRIRGSCMPGIEDFVSDYVRTTYGDVEAMAAFRQTLEWQQATGDLD